MRKGVMCGEHARLNTSMILRDAFIVLFVNYAKHLI